MILPIERKVKEKRKREKEKKRKREKEKKRKREKEKKRKEIEVVPFSVPLSSSLPPSPAPQMEDKKLMTFTFGSPRVGNKVFHQHFNLLVPGERKGGMGYLCRDSTNINTHIQFAGEL